MGSRADTEFEDAAEGLASEVAEAAEATVVDEKPAGRKKSKSIYWILGGLVVTGIAAGWGWLRRLPK
jgi:hypothetical protein